MNGNVARDFFQIEAPGIRCKLTALGASIVSLEVFDVHGDFLGIALSPANLEDASDDPAQAGRTVGPCCGRVRDGRIEIDGDPIQLERNAGAHHMHGGSAGCAHQHWEGTQLSASHVRFRLRLADSLAGYPGNRELQADYIASENSLEVRYSARTDRPTWLCLTNHVYWDLSGKFDGSAMRQHLQIAAEHVIYNGSDGLAESIEPIRGSAFDFRTPASIEQRLLECADDPQLVNGRGFDNALLLDESLCAKLGFSAQMTSPDSGLQITLRTDAPALIFYAGGFLDSRTRLLRGGSATPSCALALEPIDGLDPFHLPGAVPNILRPGETWNRSIRWSFGFV